MMHENKKTDRWPVFALVCLAMIVSVPLHADDWKQIGSAHAAHKVETDKIVIHDRTEFRDVKLRVENLAIMFKNVKVVFDNGEEQTLPVREYISAGNETRSFSLQGGPRRISKIYVEYESRPTTQHLGLKEGKLIVYASQ